MQNLQYCILFFGVAILCPRTLRFFRSLSGGVGVSKRLLFRVRTRYERPVSIKIVGATLSKTVGAVVEVDGRRSV